MLAVIHRACVANPFLNTSESAHDEHENGFNPAASVASGWELVKSKVELDSWKTVEFEYGRVAVDSNEDAVVFGRCSHPLSRAAVVFAGNVTNVEEVCELYGLPLTNNPTALLLGLYLKGFADVYGDATDQPTTSVAAMEGDFAFVLHDPAAGYTLAARSSNRTPLFWGVDPARELLVMASRPVNDLNEFPRGCLYESWVSEEFYDFRMINFKKMSPASREVDAIEKVDSFGQFCGIVFRSCSGTDLLAAAQESDTPS